MDCYNMPKESIFKTMLTPYESPMGIYNIRKLYMVKYFLEFFGRKYTSESHIRSLVKRRP